MPVDGASSMVMNQALLGADTRRLNALRKQGEQMKRPQADMARVDAVAREYEAVFLGQMLQHMYSGIPTDPMFGGGNAEKIYRSMMVDEYGKVFARAGGIGLADHIKQELLKLQEVH